MLTVADAARVAQRSVRTIRRAYLSAKLVAHRDGNGRSVRIRYGDLRAWLMAEVIRQGRTEPASSQAVGRVKVRKPVEGRSKTGNLELLNAARARRTRAARASSAGRPAEGRGGSRTT
ncbi:MAG: helix-turn-helix domain-containing protein [Beggiatoa sp.]|nr:helix-turn-helix domain-containing protein [Beggiatoa sp.]